MKSEISVVILTYNNSKTIEKCLKSLEDQTNKNFEGLANSWENFKQTHDQQELEIKTNGSADPIRSA